MLSDNSPNGIMCPGLREFEWSCIDESLPFFRLFLSPHLTVFSFRCSCFLGQVSDKVLANLTSAISELPASSLQSLCIKFYTWREVTSMLLESALSSTLSYTVSSTVLRCGSSLTSLYVDVPLSDMAVQHIMKLPRLAFWEAVNGPPKVSDLSLPDTFPQLEILKLLTEASLEWIPFFEAISRHVSSGQPSNRGPVQKLIVLESWAQVPLDAAFMSPIIRFRGLVKLTLKSSCLDMNGCTFSLTDDDVAEIAIALPRLKDATFGCVCSANSCRTTVSSLLSLSTHCKDLEELEIHFNTTNILGDFTSISEDLWLRCAHSLPRCRLWLLNVRAAPLQIRVEDCRLVGAGFLRIFPSLSTIVRNRDEDWEGILE